MGIYSNVPKPPKRIIYDGEKFNNWVKWARKYKPKTSIITPFGQIFEDEDDYYNFLG